MHRWRVFYYLPLVLLTIFLQSVRLPISHAEDAAATETSITTVEATIGDLVKSPDASAVYYLAEDGERYAFPNENVYDSWYSNFDSVKEISAEDLASVKLGGVVDYQAGTSLVKIPSVPTVYAVEPDGVLRPIESESDAETLYGSDWASKVDDLSEAFFPKYTVGEAIDVSAGELPEGYLLQDDSGNVYRTNSEGKPQEVDDLISEDMQSLYEKYASDYGTVSKKFEEQFGSFDVESFDPSMISSAMDELNSQLSPVFVQESKRLAQEKYDQYTFTAKEDGTMSDGSSDDANMDGMKDYWADVYSQSASEGSKDTNSDGVDDWWASNYETWKTDGYSDYYNSYYDSYSATGEKPDAATYDDWKASYGDTSNWSSDANGYYYTASDGTAYYYDTSSAASYTYDASNSTYTDASGNAYTYTGDTGTWSGSTDPSSWSGSGDSSTWSGSTDSGSWSSGSTGSWSGSSDSGSSGSSGSWSGSSSSGSSSSGM